MSKFVESLKRLFVRGKVTEEKIADLLARETITKDEYDYITADKPSSDNGELQAFYDSVTQEVGV